VRTEASALVVEMYRWLGAVIETQIQSLRAAQVNDLKAAFQDVQPGKAIPERFLRSQQNMPIPVAAVVEGNTHWTLCVITCK
jgi:cytoskeleton-associated protein 5